LKKLLVIPLILIVVFTGFGQQTSHKKYDDPKLKRILQKGIQLKRQGKYDKAIRKFEKILKKDADYVPAYVHQAGIYYQQGKLELAESRLEMAVNRDSTFNSELFYSLGQIREKLGERAAAIPAYEEYIKQSLPTDEFHVKARKHVERLNFVIDAMENPVRFEAHNPGDQINTSAHEYLAALDVTGTHMVFTRRINRQEDLYQSFKKDGKWLSAKPIEELNTPYNEAAHSLSPDGRYLYFTACENSITYGSCDIFYSEIKKGKWQKAQNLGNTVNSGSWDSQPVVSADGNVLYFSSTRPGGFGGRDIWYSVKDRSGAWGTPKNAGDIINTNRNEEAPFLHADGVHLYFMSNGHLGMGGYDLFVSVLDGNIWSEPKNLGYPINTEKDEGALRVAADGKTAFFASDRLDLSEKKQKDLNIYSFELYPEISSIPVSYVEGIVVDKENKLALEVTITVYDNLSGKWIRDIETDQYGQFLLALPPGKSYNLSIQDASYIFYSEHFDLEQANDVFNPYFLKIQLLQIDKEGEVDEKIRFKEEIILKNVFFDSGSSVLNTSLSAVELDHLISFLQKNEGIRISIEGHTDNVGNEQDNLDLSLARAKRVRDYLIDKGIIQDRLQFIGFGESKAIDSNESPEGRQNNRRTSFKIISK